MSSLVIAAPLSGWATRLDEVPDPAFAQGLVGDGVAIDPTSSELCAPCDGVVATLHRAHHACTVRSDGGAEILLHIGIDTVELAGDGFHAVVAAGQRVRAGDPLIRFDIDRVARRARSLHTLVVLVGGDGLAVTERAYDREIATGERLMVIGPAPGRLGTTGEPGDGAAARDGEGDRIAVGRARLTSAGALHARPAARFARRARQHAGAVTVACGPRSANGKSVTAVMALDVQPGDELVITASGPGAEPTASELAALVAAGLGEPAHQGQARPVATPAARRAAVAAAPVAAPATGGVIASVSGDALPGAAPAPGDTAASGGDVEVVLDGVAAAPGLALGRVVRLADTTAGPEVARDGDDPASERARLATALAELRREIAQMRAGAQARGDIVADDIFSVHIDLLDDPDLVAAADREIASGRTAAWAWRTALRERADVLGGLGNPVLAERAADLADLERRALARLGEPHTASSRSPIAPRASATSRIPVELPAHAVVIADELSPSELAAVPARLAGLCTARGGPTSHVAILAAGIGVPAVVALGESVLRVPDGAPVIIDGDRGQLRVFPPAALRHGVERALADQADRKRADRAAAHAVARTTDGAEIAVHANLGRPGDAALAVECGADGCGLLRTEFLFLDRPAAPSEDEQAACYQAIADALRGRPLVIRTLDAGGDKPLAYLPHGREDNPALGVRGVRLTLRHPALLRAQLRAILRVRPAGACRIMIPMVAAAAELQTVRAMLDEECRALGVAVRPQLGAMIEVPAAALVAERLAAASDFFSIGTNDLAQYTLAIDRGNPDIAGGLDDLHPAVLRLVASAARGARTRDLPVAVCGGAAANPGAVPLLVGLGVRALSVPPAAIPEVKALVRTLSLARCGEVATRALELDSGDAVRALAARTWPSLADAIEHSERSERRERRERSDYSGQGGQPAEPSDAGAGRTDAAARSRGALAVDPADPAERARAGHPSPPGPPGPMTWRRPTWRQ